jgi:hypothetical protein
LQCNFSVKSIRKRVFISILSSGVWFCCFISVPNRRTFICQILGSWNNVASENLSRIDWSALNHPPRVCKALTRELNLTQAIK